MASSLDPDPTKIWVAHVDPPAVVLPCGGRKALVALPAAQLYRDSYFRAALGAARAITSDDRIRILSGRYGFVALDQVLEPYEQRIDRKGAVSIDQLEAQVARDAMLIRVRDGELACHVFAGAAYAWRAVAVLGDGARVPLQLGTARGIGDHLRYFAAIQRTAA